MTPEILVLTATPTRIPIQGDPETLPTRVCARAGSAGLAWEALPSGVPDPPADESLTLDLGRDLADLAGFPEVGEALDAWWSALEPRLPARAPLAVVLPFACLPRGARAFRSWAARKVGRPLIVVAECLLPVLEGLDRMRGQLEARPEGADSLEFALVEGSRRLRVQGARDRVLRLDILGREPVGDDTPGSIHEIPVGDLGAAIRRLVESLRAGPSCPVRLRLRPTWSLVPRGSHRPVFSARSPRRARVWQTSLHLREATRRAWELDLVCALGPAACDRSRVATLQAPDVEVVRLDLWLSPRGGRARAMAAGGPPPDFQDFPMPVLLA